MVIKRKEWYKNNFISVFGCVKIHEIEDILYSKVKKEIKTMERKEEDNVLIYLTGTSGVCNNIPKQCGVTTANVDKT